MELHYVFPACSVPLGTACTYGILGGSTVTNLGPSNVTGDIGVWPGTAITGFPPGTLTGTEHAGDAVAQTAQGDLTVAYDYAAGAAWRRRTSCGYRRRNAASWGLQDDQRAAFPRNNRQSHSQWQCEWCVDLPDRVHPHDSSEQQPSHLGRWCRVGTRVLAGWQFGDARNHHHIRRNHYGSGLGLARHRRDAEWQGAGPDGGSHNAQQSGERTSVSMRNLCSESGLLPGSEPGSVETHDSSYRCSEEFLYVISLAELL